MMDTRYKLFTFVYYLLSVLFWVQGDYSYLFGYFDLRKLAYLLFTPAHYVFEELYVLFIEVDALEFPHVT
jgi:hypothetical protein